METKNKTTLSYIPSHFLLAPGFLRWGAKALKTAVVNDNIDDDPPPSASAPIPIMPKLETEDDADLPGPLPAARRGKPESNRREASRRRPPGAF
jgi:hypothetical protein